MSTIVIYHADCPDGFGAAFAAWLVFGDSAQYVPARFGEPAPDVRGKEVYILDFSRQKFPFGLAKSSGRWPIGSRTFPRPPAGAKPLPGLPAPAAGNR